MAQKVPLLYLASDFLQNSKRRGTQFVAEFWKVLPSAIKDGENKGDDRGKNVVSRLNASTIGAWEQAFSFCANSEKGFTVYKNARDPSRKILAKELEEEEALLKQCIEKLKVVEANRLALVSQLRGALHEQESELENVRTQMQVAVAQVEEAASMRKQLEEVRVFLIKPSAPSSVANAKQGEMPKKSAAAIAAEVADKLTASSSSQDMMISALSSLAAEEAKDTALMNSLASSTPFATSIPKTISDPSLSAQPNPQNNPYQSLLPQTSIQFQISNTPALYHSTLNPPFQYLQPPGGTIISYEYGNLPPPSLVPPAPVLPSYMVSPMVSLNQNQMQMAQRQTHSGPQPSTLPMQQPMHLSQQLPASPNFRPLAPGQSPGVLYYTHPYQSQ